MKAGRSGKRIWLIASVSISLLLAAAVIALGGHVPFYPQDSVEQVIFFALICLIVGAFGIFTLILTRTLVRIGADRGTGRLGSRFKAKMVIGAMSLSLLPIVFMAFFSYALLNHTLNSWFPRPLEIANSQSQALLDELVATGYARRSQQAKAACELASKPGTTPAALVQESPEVSAIWFYSTSGSAKSTFPNAAPFADKNAMQLARTLPNGAQLWTGSRGTYIGGK